MDMIKSILKNLVHLENPVEGILFFYFFKS